VVDEVRAIAFLLERDLEGPVNLSAPQPVRQVELARTLGRALHRPALLPAPAFGLRLVLGDFADDVLASQRMLPSRLLDAGFAFNQRTVEQAVDRVLRQD
jgi:NAD dependent epimerase/dehydratase family enzyme